MKPTDAKPEGYWSQFSDDGDDVEEVEQDDGVETHSVAEAIREEVEGTIHGLAVTRRQEETAYLVMARSTTWDAIDEDRPDIPVTDLRTVVVDLDAEHVRVSDNGIWFPRDSDVTQSVTEVMARTTTDHKRGADPEEGPALRSGVDSTDAERLLGREIEVEQDSVEGQHVDKMESHGGIDPARSWGYGAGPPEEVDYTAARLEEAGLDPSEHLSRLVWGKKEPMDRRGRPVEELTGNYGIELLPRESGLIAIDVDYPEHFPQSELPETLEVSSPHGDDDRRHILLRCDDKEALAEEVGAWAVQRVDWGDLWIGDRYLVGPGSQLSEFGCDTDGYTRGERGGCESCEDTDGGFYRVVSDAPIATVSSDRVLALLEESSGYTLRNGPADPDPPESDDGDDVEEVEEDDRLLRCDSCGERREPEEVETLAVGDDERVICSGGCE